MAEAPVVPKASVIGSPEQIDAAVVVAREYAAHVEHDARPLARSYRRLREGGAHLKWLKDEPRTWERFCREALGYEVGFLGPVEAGVRALEGGGYDGPIPRQRAIEEAERLGAAPKSGEIGRNRRATSTPNRNRGTVAAYNARRLRRDAPDMYEAYKAGQYPSANAAAIAAGIAKRRIGVEPVPAALDRFIRRHLTPEQRGELLRLLTEAP